jgi:hypothetical protein
MMLLERWAVGAILALTVPLVSTAGGVFEPQQTRNTRTAHPVRNQDPDEQQGPDALPSKTIDEQDAPYIKAGEEQDAQSAKTGEDSNAEPAKTAEDPIAPAAKTADDPIAPSTKAADDQDVQPVKAAEPDPPAEPVKAAEDLPAPPPPPSPIQNPQPAKAVVSVPSSPATQEQKDTAQLLQLVQELKAEVEKAGSNTLSLAALRKADEIQRLVKNLKEKMKVEGQGLVNKP